MTAWIGKGIQIAAMLACVFFRGGFCSEEDMKGIRETPAREGGTAAGETQSPGRDDGGNHVRVDTVYVVKEIVREKENASTGKESGGTESEEEKDGDENQNNEEQPPKLMPRAYAFPHKVVFSETADIGYHRRGGFRQSDIVILEFYWNFSDWAMIDLFLSGMPHWRIADGENTGDSLIINRDNLIMLTVKSRPLCVPFLNSGSGYFAAGGMKLYSSATQFTMKKTDVMQDTVTDTLTDTHDRSINFFVSQSLWLSERLLANLHGSLALRHSGGGSMFTTYYLVPGMRVFWGKKKYWSFGMEYYLMNPVEFPYKTLQWAFAGMEFGNLGHDLVTWTFFGISFHTRRFRADLNVGCHNPAIAPYFPIIGFGWNF